MVKYFYRIKLTIWREMSFIFAFIAGAVLILQSSINAQLLNFFESPIHATTVSFIAGTIALLFVCLFVKSPLPDIGELTQIKLWQLSGGAIGAIYVLSIISLLPKLVTANLFSLIIAGQMIMSLIFDHFGFFGMPTHPVNTARVAGTFLLITSVYIIQKA